MHPGLLDKIPEGSEIDFLEMDLPRFEGTDSMIDKVQPLLFKVEHFFRDLSAEK